MPSTKDKLQEKMSAFIHSASESELESMERMLSGWEKKRKGYYHSEMGSLLQLESHWEEDTYVVTLPLHKDLENKMDITHGGVIATMLDDTMGEVAGREAPEGYSAVTLEIKINYVKPGTGENLRCEAKCLSKSKKTIFMTGSVFKDDGSLAAHATATFYAVRL